MNIKYLVLILLFCSAPYIASAENTVIEENKNPHQIVEDASKKVTEVLKKEQDEISKNPNKINDLVDDVIMPVCDLQQMGKYILGKHWKTASIDQRERFINEFKQMLIRTYGQHVAEYSNAEISVLPEKNVEKKRYSTVSTKLDPKDGSKPIQIDYVFKQTDLEPGKTARIVDVRVEGLSILKTFKSAFTYEIAESSLDDLIDRLAQSNQPKLAQH